MFQTIDKNGRPFTGALTHSSRNNETNVILFGLLPDEFELICDELSTSPHLSACPTFIPICLIDIVREVIEYDLEKGRNTTHDIMLELGMTKSSTEGAYNDHSLRQYDFLPITRALTRLTAKMSKCELACDAHSLLLDQMDQEHAKWAIGLNDEDRRKIDTAATVLQTRSESMRVWMQAMKLRTKHISNRSQAYVQTVSIIGIVRDCGQNHCYSIRTQYK